MNKTYYCSKCEQRHIKSKGIGEKHREFETEAPAKPAEKCSICHDTGVIPTGDGGLETFCECGQETNLKRIGVVGPRNPDEAQPPITEPPRDERCAICNDTGMVELGVNARAFCKCGQETHDETIGLIPRRPDLGPARPISDEDRAEADYRRSHGGPHDEYIKTISEAFTESAAELAALADAGDTGGTGQAD